MVPVRKMSRTTGRALSRCSSGLTSPFAARVPMTQDMEAAPMYITAVSVPVRAVDMGPPGSITQLQIL